MSNLLPFVEAGRKDGKLIVFMAGFPDNETSGWGEVIPKELSKDNKLIFMCMPEFHKGNTKYKPWGYSFPEIIERMHSTIQSVNPSNEKFILVGHDWGAQCGFLFENRYPQLAEKLIILDVGLLNPKEVPIGQLLLILLYQLWFAIAFIIAQIVSLQLGNFQFLSFYWPVFKGISPCPNDELTIPVKELTVQKCYPYYHYWKGQFTKAPKPRFPSCPLLYMYGTNKRCFFHGKSFLKRIEKTTGSKYSSCSGGHWFAKTHGDEVVKAIQDFLK